MERRENGDDGKGEANGRETIGQEEKGNEYEDEERNVMNIKVKKWKEGSRAVEKFLISR